MAGLGRRSSAQCRREPATPAAFSNPSINDERVGHLPHAYLVAQHPIGKGAQPLGQTRQQLLAGLVRDALAVGVGERHQVVGGGGGFGIPGRVSARR